ERPDGDRREHGARITVPWTERRGWTATPRWRDASAVCEQVTDPPAQATMRGVWTCPRRPPRCSAIWMSYGYVQKRRTSHCSSASCSEDRLGDCTSCAAR